MAQPGGPALDPDAPHGSHALHGADPHDDDHDDHGPSEDPRWVLLPLVIGLVIGLVLAIIFGLGSGASQIG